jgi:hypothetical protein
LGREAQPETDLKGDPPAFENGNEAENKNFTSRMKEADRNNVSIRQHNKNENENVEKEK